jgi:hypothetical protein
MSDCDIEKICVTEDVARVPAIAKDVSLMPRPSCEDLIDAIDNGCVEAARVILSLIETHMMAANSRIIFYAEHACRVLCRVVKRDDEAMTDLFLGSFVADRFFRTTDRNAIAKKCNYTSRPMMDRNDLLCCMYFFDDVLDLSSYYEQRCFADGSCVNGWAFAVTIPPKNSSVSAGKIRAFISSLGSRVKHTQQLRPLSSLSDIGRALKSLKELKEHKWERKQPQ